MVWLVSSDKWKAPLDNGFFSKLPMAPTQILVQSWGQEQGYRRWLASVQTDLQEPCHEIYQKTNSGNC